MRSKKKNRLASIDARKTSSTAKPAKEQRAGGLMDVKIRLPRKAISEKDVTFIFRHVSTLVENGVSLPKALDALADERGLENARETLVGLRKMLQSGASFSAALASYPDQFDTITVNQVKVGERAGALGEALANLASQREKAGEMKGEILKKLSYPLMLMVVGTGVIAFLLAYVVPVFEETYNSANVPLPGVTQMLIMVGHIAQQYWMGLLLLAAASFFGLAHIRKNDNLSRRMDYALIHAPLIGQWMRDIAVLELIEILGNLMEAGFTLSEALGEAVDSVNNKAIKASAADLQMAVNRGERFSREVEKHADLFPPLVSQLVIIGEQTGNLTNATRTIREHLRGEIERRGNMFVGVIEPTLTISLASAVAVILLAIYLPMFDMINTAG